MLNFIVNSFEKELIKHEPEIQKAVLFGVHLIGSKVSSYATKKIEDVSKKLEGNKNA